MHVTLTPTSSGKYSLTLETGILEIVGLDPTATLDLSTDGRRLILQAAAATLPQQLSSPPAATAGVPTRRSPMQFVVSSTSRVPMSCLKACHKWLLETGGDHHTTEITNEILRLGYWVSEGQTPDASVAARLTMECLRLGEKSRFIKTGPNRFKAREGQP